MRTLLLAASLAWVPGAVAARDCPRIEVSGPVLGLEAGAEARPRTARLVIEDGVFVSADPVAEAAEPDGPCAFAVPEGAVVSPGLVDGHAHLLGIGLRKMSLNLEGLSGIAELRERLREAADETPRRPIFGRGWIETGWPENRMPVAADLDAVVPDRPVVLTRADGHALVANGAALVAAGIDAGTPDPEGGRIVRDADGAATGLLIDGAMALVEGLRPPLSASRRKEALRRGAEVYAARGWTGVHDMSVDAEDVAILAELARRGDLPIRVWSYVTPEAMQTVEPGCDPTGRACVQGLKIYVDGALGSRGALLAEPYADEPGTRGLQLVDAERAGALYAEAEARGFQVTTHAIGDEGNRLVLDWYADLAPQEDAPHGSPRRRIEHAQILDPDDIKRFSRQGVIASMQPSHAIGDLHFAADRLGDARLDGAYAWASLHGTGAVVVGGSDAPVEVGDPRIELYAATERRDLLGFQGPDWRAREALSRRAALRLFTAAPAYAVFEEDRLGAIAPGYAGDLSVFCGDPFGGPDAAAPLFTMVAGAVVSGDPGAACPGGAAR